MECLVEKDDLLRCLYLVQGVVEKRSSLPNADPRALGTSLDATDLEREKAGE